MVDVIVGSRLAHQFPPSKHLSLSLMRQFWFSLVVTSYKSKLFAGRTLDIRYTAASCNAKAPKSRLCAVY